MPDRVIDKSKIGFFAASVDGWFRAQAQGRSRSTCRSPGRATPRSSSRRSCGLVARQKSPEAAERRLLLAILMLEVWLSSYVPRALPPSLEGRRSRLAAWHSE